jgi:hypothetical protein
VGKGATVGPYSTPLHSPYEQYWGTESWAAPAYGKGNGKYSGAGKAALEYRPVGKGIGGKDFVAQSAWDELPAPSEEAIIAFVEQWELDLDCARTLSEQLPAVQNEMLNSFSPKAGTRNNTSLFHGFLKSVLRSHPTAQNESFMGPRSIYESHWEQPVTQGKGQWQSSSGPFGVNDARKRPLAEASDTIVNPDDIMNFCSSWELDDDCYAGLMELPPDLQVHVMERFAPKEGTRNVADLFKGFVRSFKNGPGHSKRSRGYV